MTTKEKLPPIDQEKIRDVSEKVYRARLSEHDAATMPADQMRRNAGSYDTLTRVYMEALGVELPRVAQEREQV